MQGKVTTSMVLVIGRIPSVYKNVEAEKCLGQKEETWQFWYIGFLFQRNKYQRPKAQEKLPRGDGEWRKC